MGVEIVRGTLAASIVLAVVALSAGLVLGRGDIGFGLAAGLVIGAFNGELVRRVTIIKRAPLLMSSVIRLAALSASAIVLAYVFHASTIALLLGVACAQLVMVGVAVREGLRP